MAINIFEDNDPDDSGDVDAVEIEVSDIHLTSDLTPI